MSANISSPKLRILLDDIAVKLSEALSTATDSNLSVTVGAADSGGTGKRALFVIDNA